MILSDTDILSALAKVNQLELLYSLFEVEQLYIVPAVLHELEVARNQHLTFSRLIVNYIEIQRIEILALTLSETAFSQTLPHTLGIGERESLAVAYQRKSVLLSNESRVTHWSRRLNIEYFDLPLLLRAFWTDAVLTQDEVRQLISDLYVYDKMGLSAKNRAAIFLPKE
jgi:predicted nucleic acid-binding protein